MSLVKTVDQAKVLVEMSLGILSRIYVMKGSLLLPEMREFIEQPDLLKIRYKIEKKYPAMADFQKISGGDVFQQLSGVIFERYGPMNDLIIDIVEYCDACLAAFRELTTKTLDFKLRKNRAVLVLCFDLLTSYQKVLLMLESLTERKTVMSMHAAAASFELPPGSVNQFAIRIKTLLDACEDLDRHFIDCFAGSLSVLQPMLLQLQPSLALGADLAALRKAELLNFASEGEKMGLPAERKEKGKLSYQVQISAYTELRGWDKYCEYVVYALLCCPALLFDESVLTLLNTVTQNRLVVEIFREMSLNIHVSLERISGVFPSGSDVFKIPKGFKLKAVLKKCSRDSVSAAGLNMKRRRAYLEGELRTINNLLELVPGLVAPKFPLILAAASMAKAELLSYYRHIDGVVQVRKDSRTFFTSKHYFSSDISSLLSALYATLAKLKAPAQRSIVSRYYSAYLSGCDLRNVLSLSGECEKKLPSLHAFCQAFSADLSAYAAIASSLPSLGGTAEGATGNGGADASNGGDGAGSGDNGDADKAAEARDLLFSLRVNLDRFVALSGEHSVSALVKTAPAFDSLVLRLVGAAERSLYADAEVGLLGLVNDECDPCGVTFFRKPFLTSFSHAYKDPHSLAANAFAYFAPFESILLATHPDCPEERAPMGESARAVCNLMMNDLCAFVLTLIKHLWDYIAALEGQYHAIETAKRMERQMIIKMKGATASGPGAAAAMAEGGVGDFGSEQPSAAAAAALAAESAFVAPGTESECWAKQSIGKFVLIRRNLSMLMHAAARRGTIFVYSRAYEPHVFLLKHVNKYLKGRLHGLFFSGGERMARSSVSLSKFVSGCRAVQYALSFIGAGAALSVRELLYFEFSEPSLPPPGLPVPAALEFTPLGGGSTPGAPPGKGSHSLISRVVSWFVSIAQQVGTAGSGLLWVPAQNCFVNAVSKGYLRREDYPHASRLAVDLHVDREELHSLVVLAGAQGVRAVDSQLMKLVMEQMEVVLSFLEKYENNLTELQRNYALSLSMNLGVRGIDSLNAALTKIGIALALREVLYATLEKTMRVRRADLLKATQTAADSVSVWRDLSLVTPLLSLAASVGAGSSLSTSTTSSARSANSCGGCVDINFAAAFAAGRVYSAQDLRLLRLLPVAAASSFMSEKWLRADYVPELEAFDGNEHCMQIAISRLLFASFYLQTLAESGSIAIAPTPMPSASSSSSPPAALSLSLKASGSSKRTSARGYTSPAIELEEGEESDIADHDTEAGTVEDKETGGGEQRGQLPLTAAACKDVFRSQYLETYMCIASQVLCMLRQQEEQSHTAFHPPFRPMGLMLEYFLRMCGPVAERGLLERYLPNAVLHSSLVDISLGKQRSPELLLLFMHAVETDAELLQQTI